MNNCLTRCGRNFRFPSLNGRVTLVGKTLIKLILSLLSFISRGAGLSEGLSLLGDIRYRTYRSNEMVRRLVKLSRLRWRFALHNYNGGRRRWRSCLNHHLFFKFHFFHFWHDDFHKLWLGRYLNYLLFLSSLQFRMCVGSLSLRVSWAYMETLLVLLEKLLLFFFCLPF